jgi:ribonuclease R
MVLELLKRERHPLVLRDFVRRFDLTHEEKRRLKVLLKEMISEGQIIRIRGRRYGLPTKMNVIVGRLQCHPDGYGVEARAISLLSRGISGRLCMAIR